MLGAIIGDVIGSSFEWDNIYSKDFPLFQTTSKFTDDSVMTCAIAEWVLNGDDLKEHMLSWGHRYPNAGYGGMFAKWLGNPVPYNSFGNGSAMRVSPIGHSAQTMEQCLLWAKESAEVSHNHPEGIKGAQAVAGSIFMAKQGQSREEIRTWVANTFQYDVARTLADIRPTYQFNATCQGSVPEAIIAYLDSISFEDAIRSAVSIGGDSDTIACIAGSIAEMSYGLPTYIVQEVLMRLPDEMTKLINRFYGEFYSREIS